MHSKLMRNSVRGCCAWRVRGLVPCMRVFALAILCAGVAGCRMLRTSASLLTPVAVTKNKPFIIAESGRRYGKGVLSHPRIIDLGEGRIILRYYVGGDKVGRYFEVGSRDITGVGPAISSDGGRSWIFGEENLDPVVAQTTHYVGADIGLRDSVLLGAARTMCEVDRNGNLIGEPWEIGWPTNMPSRGKYYPGYHRGLQDRNGALYTCIVQVTEKRLWKKRQLLAVQLMESKDGGKSWIHKSTIADPDDVSWGKEYPVGYEGPNEPSLILLPDGDMICVMRTGMKQFTQWEAPKDSMSMVIARSSDGGLSWERRWMRQSGVYPKLLQMSNGVLVLAFGRPGNSLAFSTDGGRTWGLEIPLTAADAKSSGYCDVVEVAPGRLLVVFDAYNTDLRGFWLWEPKEVNALYGMYVDVRRLVPGGRVGE